LELERNNWRSDDQHRQNDAGQDRLLNRDQPDALEPEGDARPRRPLHRFDVDLTFRVLFEHTLSSSHIGSIV
jgi:hypothetical protein